MSSLVFVFAALCRAEVPPGEPVPPLLLSAPVNATLTANQASEYRTLGFNGFIFRGIIDGLGREYCGLSGDWPAFWKGDPLYQEIALAVRRLAAEGMPENFLWLPLSPERAWFTEREFFREGVNTISYAAAFARAAGMKGLALDLRDSGSLFDLRWAAYRLDESGVLLAKKKAEEFGRAAAQAAMKACPEIAMLIVSAVAQMYSPLWTAFVDGTCQAMAAAGSTARPILIVDVQSFGGDPERGERIARGLLGHLAPNSAKLINERGGMAPLLSLAASDYRRRIAMAQATARGYLVAEAAWSSLTPVSGEQAEEFRHLKQGGAARVTASTGSGLPSIALTTAQPGMRRMGMAYLEGHSVQVFAGDEGAALLLPAGLQTPITLRQRATPLRMTRLEDGSRAWIAPKQGEVTVPPEGPCFIEPLDHETWSLPASLRLDLQQPPEAGPLRLPLLIQCANPTPAALNGLLDIALPTGLSLGAQPLRAALAPGARFNAQRHLQGVVHAGDRFALSVNWFLDTGATAHRDVIVRILPRERWHLRMDGPLLAGGATFAVMPARDAEEAMILAASTAGDYVLMQGTGQMRWRTRFRLAASVAPAMARGPAGTRIFVQSAANRVSLLDTESGFPLRHLDLAEELSAMLAISRDTGEVVAVVALRNGDLLAVDGELTPQWNAPLAALQSSKHATKTEGRCILALAPNSGRIAALFMPAGGPGTLACFDHAGTLLSRETLPRPAAACAPFFMKEAESAALVQPFADGTLFIMPVEGGKAELYAPARPSVPMAAGPLRDGVGERAAFFVADSNGIRRMDTAGKVLAEVPLMNVSGLAPVRVAGEDIAIAATDAGLAAFDWHHRLLWRDDRVPGGCLGPVWAGELDADGQMLGIYAAADATLRCVELGPRETPPRPGQGLPRRIAP